MAFPAFRWIKARKFVVGDDKEPVERQAAIPAAAGDDAASINAIIATLVAFGLVEEES